MPTNLAPAGTATANTFFAAGYEAANVNNGIVEGSGEGIYWVSANDSTHPRWVRVQLAEAAVVTRYVLIANAAGSDSPSNFKLQGSNDGSAWTDLNTQVAAGSGDPATTDVTFSNSTAYLYYRVYITASGSLGYTVVRELELHGDVPTGGDTSGAGMLAFF